MQPPPYTSPSPTIDLPPPSYPTVLHQLALETPVDPAERTRRQRVLFERTWRKREGAFICACGGMCCVFVDFRRFPDLLDLEGGYEGFEGVFWSPQALGVAAAIASILAWLLRMFIYTRSMTRQGFRTWESILMDATLFSAWTTVFALIVADLCKFDKDKRGVDLIPWVVNVVIVANMQAVYVLKMYRRTPWEFEKRYGPTVDKEIRKEREQQGQA